ncbi:hypothetical protein JIN86_10605 [Lysinibacillus sp. HST-98]|uniref:VanZ family protein n=1 Tax=Lysinibacillus sp. HST-98 TaxID=2800419 RepID=UPI0019283AD5|nr:VanZ family protein [Lysinibacillus sp. HST-98]MBL3730053.1 hypothetical protein [Lysinibacillus sp. HST-98]
MHTNYVLYNIVPFGFLVLLVYIFIDVFLDYFRKEIKPNQRRVTLYSFLFYLLCLLQIKVGGITLLPLNPADKSRSFITANDWFGIFDGIHFSMYLWSYSAIVYNFLLLLPLGIFLFVLFHFNNRNKAIFIVILCCLGIELLRLLLGAFSLVPRNIGSLDGIYLLCNMLGGIVGILIVKIFTQIKVKRKDKVYNGSFN